MYNFHIFLVILAIISPIAAYNRKQILQKIPIQNEIMFISVFILVVYSIIQLINKKNIIINIDKKTLGYLIFNGILTCIVLYFGGLIIIKENIFKFKTLQKGVYLIILVIIGSCVYKQSLNLKIILGLSSILFGSYLIDKSI